MIAAMIGDLQERIPPLDVPPSEGLASGGGETPLFGRQECLRLDTNDSLRNRHHGHTPGALAGFHPTDFLFGDQVHHRDIVRRAIR